MTERSQVWKLSDQKKGLQDIKATCKNSITGPTRTTPGMNERNIKEQMSQIDRWIRKAIAKPAVSSKEKRVNTTRSWILRAWQNRSSKGSNSYEGAYKKEAQISRCTARQEQAGQALAKPASILRGKKQPRTSAKHMAMNSGIDRGEEKWGNELEKWTPREKRKN